MDGFLVALRDTDPHSLPDIFGPDFCFVGACGKLGRGQKEIVVKPGIASCPLRQTMRQTGVRDADRRQRRICSATLLWEEVHLPGFPPLDLFRMCILLVNREWYRSPT